MRVALVLASLVVYAAACGGGGNSSPTAVPKEAVTVKIVAGNRVFDLATITIPANSHVTVELDSLDAGPYNFAVYESPAAEQEIFVADTIAGRGAKTTGEFDAPPPGTYFFRCDVHPVAMTGKLIVE